MEKNDLHLFAQYPGENTAALEEKADMALARIDEGQNWADWRAIAEFLADGRRMAWEAAGRPKNSYDAAEYRRLFGRWLNLHPKYRAINKATRAHLFWYVDNRPDVEGWRDTLAQNVRARFNHPSSLKRNFEAAQRISAGKFAPKPSGKTALIAEIDHLTREIKRRDEEIAWRKSADGGSSLFDLRRDTADNIAKTILGHLKLVRTRGIRDALTKVIRRTEDELRKQKQAG
jgi:hypothetical protein